MFKRNSITPIFVMFLIVACFDGLFFARATNCILDERKKQGVLSSAADIEFTLVLGSPKDFYRSQGKTLKLDVGGCQVKIEKDSADIQKVKVSGGSGEEKFSGSILYFKVDNDVEVHDENTGNAKKICSGVTIEKIFPTISVLIKLDGEFASGLFLYGLNFGSSCDPVPPSTSTELTTTLPSTSTELTTTLPSTAETSPSSSECLSNQVYIAIGAAAGLVGALVIVGIVALICCLVKKKRSTEKVVVKDVSMRNEKTKETTVGAGGEKSAFKDVTDNKSAYGTSVAPSPVTPSLL